MKSKLLVSALLAASLLRADPAPFATVEISSFAQLQKDVAALGADIGQPMISLGLVGMGNFLGSPGMLGIDQNKPIRLVFATENDVLGNRPAVVVPLSEADGAGYLKSLSAIAEKAAEANGIATYTFRNFRQNARIHVANGYAVLALEGTVNETLLTRITADLAQDATAYSVKGISGTLRADLSAKFVLPILERFVRDKLESIEDDEDRLAVRASSDKLMDLLRGTSRIALGLDYTENTGLSLWSRTDALPDSPLQALFSEFKAPAPELLPYIGGKPAVLSADGAQGPVSRRLGPIVVSAVKAILSANPDNPQMAQLLPMLSASIDQFDSVPAETVTAARFDDKGRPYSLSIGLGGNPEKQIEALLAQHAVARENASAAEDNPIRFGEATTRTLDDLGVTVHTVPVSIAADGDSENPILPACAAYLKDNAFGYEYAVKDGRLYMVIGPSGIIEKNFAAPEMLPAAPLAEVFPDMKNVDESVVRFTVDYGALVHDLLVFVNNAMPEEQKMPAEVLDTLSADPGRVGFLMQAKDNTAVGVFRATPGLVRSAASIVKVFQTMQQAAIEAAMNEELEEEDLTDEDIENLLKEAEEDDGK